MNLYKLALALDEFIKDCEEAAQKEFNSHCDVLDPFSEFLHKDPRDLEEVDHTFIPRTNYRIDVFATTKDNIVYACYSPKAEAFHNEIDNSHHALAGVLADNLPEGEHLDYNRRWCGFYSMLAGNGCKYLVLYGESSDYPHNNNGDLMAELFAREVVLNQPLAPNAVILLYKDTVKLIKK